MYNHHISRVDRITIRKILMRMPYHNKVRHSGELYMYSFTKNMKYIGSDIEFFDPEYSCWDSTSGWCVNSKTRKLMMKIISVFETYSKPRRCTIEALKYKSW